MELKTLFKNSSYLITARVAKFGSGILRSKLIAIYLGTLGAGIVSQLLQITTSMYQFTVLGMNDGLIKQIAESDKNEEGFDKKLTGLIKSYVFIVALILVAAIILLMVFSKDTHRICIRRFKILSLLSYRISIVSDFNNKQYIDGSSKGF